MIRKTMTLTSVIGICIPLLISVAGASNYSLANGKYSWKSSGIDPRDGKAYERNSTVNVTRDGNKVTIESRKAQIVGTLEGNRFSGHVSERPGDYADLQGTLTSNNRKAQSNPHFAMIYEQRRTNAILIAGFSSLGQAIEHLRDRIVTAISGLAVSLDCRLASLESSLESTASAAAEQSAALRAELRHSSGVNDAVLGQLRQDAEARSESERLALRMLDNIQRRRKPTMWESP